MNCPALFRRTLKITLTPLAKRRTTPNQKTTMSNNILEPKKTHIMIDIETMGVRASSFILSLGAVKFDEHGIYSSFYCKFSHAKSTKYERTWDMSTMAWWDAQPEAVRIEAFNGKVELRAGLAEFSLWAQGAERIWGNGSAFDVAILRDSLFATEVDKDFAPFGDRCYRTAKSLPLASSIHKEVLGTPHVAIDDARNQAAHLLAIHYGSNEAALAAISSSPVWHRRNASFLEELAGNDAASIDSPGKKILVAHNLYLEVVEGSEMCPINPLPSEHRVYVS
jgi:hypothetical protein